MILSEKHFLKFLDASEAAKTFFQLTKLWSHLKCIFTHINFQPKNRTKKLLLVYKLYKAPAVICQSAVVFNVICIFCRSVFGISTAKICQKAK